MGASGHKLECARGLQNEMFTFLMLSEWSRPSTINFSFSKGLYTFTVCNNEAYVSIGSADQFRE